MEHSSELLPEAGGGATSLLAEQATTEAALRRLAAHYYSLFRTMKQGVCLIEKVVTLPGKPSDYRYVAINQSFAQHAGLHDATGKTLR